MTNADPAALCPVCQTLAPFHSATCGASAPTVYPSAITTLQARIDTLTAELASDAQAITYLKRELEEADTRIEALEEQLRTVRQQVRSVELRLDARWGAERPNCSKCYQILNTVSRKCATCGHQN